MNKVTLIGRITKDLELRKTNNNTSVVRFTLATDRRISKEDRERGVQSADFINCIVWSDKADLVAEYKKKGDVLGLTGRLTTGSYKDQEGRTVYTTEVTVEEVDLFFGKKEDGKIEEKKFEPRPVGGQKDHNRIDLESEALPFY